VKRPERRGSNPIQSKNMQVHECGVIRRKQIRPPLDGLTFNCIYNQSPPGIPAIVTAVFRAVLLDWPRYVKVKLKPTTNAIPAEPCVNCDELPVAAAGSTSNNHLPSGW